LSDQDDSVVPSRTGQVLVASREEYAQFRSRVPDQIGAIGPIEETESAFVVRVLLDDEPGSMSVATYVVPRTTWDEWWTQYRSQYHAVEVGTVASPEAAIDIRRQTFSTSDCGSDDVWDNGILDDIPAPRAGHTAVWTGSEMIVWGGWDQEGTLNTGSRYDPATDTWTSISNENAPSGRRYHTAIWTGTRMVVWGGLGSNVFNDGGRYDPVLDRWEPVAPLGAPTPRYAHAAVWTGDRMIIWGGEPGRNDGARYDPATDQWFTVTATGAPEARSSFSAIWTGNRMIVWGGVGVGGRLATGGIYNPESDSWNPTSTIGAPQMRSHHTVVWTGSRMIVWGGLLTNFGPELDTGGMYDPVLDAWSATTTVGAPSPRYRHAAVWTGHEMIVWGGSLSLSGPERYDPVTDTWHPLNGMNAPVETTESSAVWTGTEMIVWGGGGSGAYGITNGGGRYKPETDSWIRTSQIGDAPDIRIGGSKAVWTGSFAIFWGGNDSVAPTNTGGLYDPVADSWRPTTTVGAPLPRQLHTAVWTGGEMIVWGGTDNTAMLGDGARYNPMTDTWRPMSTLNAPNGRARHTAVWTGSEMIVWGGEDGPGLPTIKYNSGGRYDPVVDTWTNTFAAGATPSPRSRHTAIWTGNRMIVWGGTDIANTLLGTGSQYNPVANSWAAVTQANAPGARWGHGAVWSGDEMLVWGGFSPYTATKWNDGGRFNPILNSWTPITIVGAPTARSQFPYVWSGKELIVWGGAEVNKQPISGGRYDPALDTWRPTSLVNTPSPGITSAYAVAWTGHQMIVLGLDARGGRYLAAGDGDWDGVVCDQDCDDDNASVYPGAPQICDGLNNDCDDPGWPAVPPTEVDDDADMVLACADCDDSDPSVFPKAPQICDGLNNDCNDSAWPLLSGTNEADDDGDGLSECAGDCDDAHPTVYPGAAQICDGLNNDCQAPGWPAPLDGDQDTDHDGVPTCANDCDDTNASVYPGAPEICDGVSNDCDNPGWPALPPSEIDIDGDTFPSCAGDCDETRPTVYAGAPQLCGDLLNNNCADPQWPQLSGTNESDDDGDSFSECQGDCDDTNADTYPGAPEVNDGVDNQCSGEEGFGVIDEVQGVDFPDPNNMDLLCWTSQARASEYVVLRAEDAVFSSQCYAPSALTNVCWADPLDPPPGAIQYYLVRASLPHTGSWGDDSSGIERNTSCSLFACGNGILEPPEKCDGADLGGVTCQSLGFDSGVLACRPTCDGFIITGCTF